MSKIWSRRSLLHGTGSIMVGAAAQAALPAIARAADTVSSLKSKRPAIADRRFTSAAVEAYIAGVSKTIGDRDLASLFVNCFPNTLDTTVEPGTFDGKADTAVITGDIAAMWVRVSSAQVRPYLPLAKQDPALRKLLEGLIRRQARCILIDPYANSFMANLNDPPLEGSRSDVTEMKQGVGERKYELDSLCSPIRLAHGFWATTGDISPFDTTWKQAMKLVVATMRTQQRKQGNGPYHFQRTSKISTETLPNDGFGNPIKPVGLIASGFRPSDDACIFPFLVPANLFAVTSLRKLAKMSHAVLADDELANEANALATEVETALRQYAVVNTPKGKIWAYEVDGFGSSLLMDDANVPSLLGLPYLESSPDAALYARTRSFVWSEQNPWFFRGTAGEGIGGPHVGMGMIWPMSQMVYVLTSDSDTEVGRALGMLKASSAALFFVPFVFGG